MNTHILDALGDLHLKHIFEIHMYVGKCAEKSGPMKLWQDLSSQTTQTLVIEDDQLNT